MSTHESQFSRTCAAAMKERLVKKQSQFNRVCSLLAQWSADARARAHHPFLQ